MALRDKVLEVYATRIGGIPELSNPVSYNDKIQWLKLYDQMPEMIECCDKLKVRDFIGRRIGYRYLIPVLAVADNLEGINFETLPNDFVLKTNHDSGSVFVVRNKAQELKDATARISKGLSKVYGVEKGEWAYSFVERKVFVEKRLPDPVVDYKFHCSLGIVKWGQVISDRISGKPKEVITTPEGKVLPYHLDHKMTHLEKYEKPPHWMEMVELAQRLSKIFRYVRVDFYDTKEQPWVGELTFWPRAGCYKTKDNVIFGEMLNFSTKLIREAIY